MPGKADIEAGRAFVRLYVKDEMLKGLASAGKALRDLSKTMTDIGTKLAASGVAMAAPIAAATKIFADFDDQMRAVQSVSQSTDAEFGRLTETAKRLGATTSFTAGQVAGLMTELGRAGFTADQIDAMTGSVLNLARATGTDATLASGIMAATIRQFGLEAKDATNVADLFTVTANKTFNSVEQLGEALSYAGPVAADLGLSLKDTLAILGSLGNVGIQGSEAGTALRRLLTLTGAEAQRMEQVFGVAFKDAAGNALPLVDTLEAVNNATKSLPNTLRAAKLNEAFGILGITAASSIGKSVGSIRELEVALTNAGGTAQRTAEKMDAGLGGAFRKLMSAIEGVAITIGEILAPTIQKFADWLTKAAEVVNRFISQNKGLVIAISSVAGGLIIAGGALVGLGTAAGFAAFAVGGLEAALGFLFSPIALAIGGVALGVGTLAYWAIEASGGFGALKAAVGEAGKVLSGFVTIISQSGLKGLGEALEKAARVIMSVVGDIFDQFPQLAGWALGRLVRGWIDAWFTMVNIARQAIDTVAQALGFALTGNFGAAKEYLEKGFSDLQKLGSSFSAGLNKEKIEFQFSDKTAMSYKDLLGQITDAEKQAAFAARQREFQQRAAGIGRAGQPQAPTGPQYPWVGDGRPARFPAQRQTVQQFYQQQFAAAAQPVNVPKSVLANVPAAAAQPRAVANGGQAANLEGWMKQVVDQQHQTNQLLQRFNFRYTR